MTTTFISAAKRDSRKPSRPNTPSTSTKAQKSTRAPKADTQKQTKTDQRKTIKTRFPGLRVPKQIRAFMQANSPKSAAGKSLEAKVEAQAKAGLAKDDSVRVDLTRPELDALRLLSTTMAQKTKGGDRMAALAKIRWIDRLTKKK